MILGTWLLLAIILLPLLSLSILLVRWIFHYKTYQKIPWMHSEKSWEESIDYHHQKSQKDSQTIHQLLVFNGIMGFFELVLTGSLIAFLIPHDPITLFGEFFYVDMLSAYHMGLVSLIITISSVYSIGYFKHEIAAGHFTLGKAFQFSFLWNGFLLMLLFVLISNNIGILWVALEASTLVSAFLIQTLGHKSSIEAMWKYLLICSVGIALALVGTFLFSLAAKNFETHLYWSQLILYADRMDPTIVLMGFLFILVGFGSKAGLAPMHTWLPDAHSQAPTPVSAAFSGMMINCALYGILRYVPLTEKALGYTNQAHTLLIIFGLLSILVAAIYIPAQKDIKRLLAYSSVEHIGIITLGFGLGGLGTFAALFHTLSHSLAKTTAFLSAGRLSQILGTMNMNSMKGVMHHNFIWGFGFFFSVLILMGVAPFSIFMSEFLMLFSAIQNVEYWAVALFMVGSIIIFISVLKNVVYVSFGKTTMPIVAQDKSWVGYSLVFIMIACLLLLGLGIPDFLKSIFIQSAQVIEPNFALPAINLFGVNL